LHFAELPDQQHARDQCNYPVPEAGRKQQTDNENYGGDSLLLNECRTNSLGRDQPIKATLANSLHGGWLLTSSEHADKASRLVDRRSHDLGAAFWFVGDPAMRADPGCDRASPHRRSPSATLARRDLHRPPRFG